MAEKKLTTAERGWFKTEIHAALYKSADIIDALIGDTTGMTRKEIMTEFKKYVKSHLFVDDTIEVAKSFIFYDVAFPVIQSNTKTCKVIMYVICHRDIIDSYSRPGYYGNRADIISEMVEDCLLNDEEVANSFGIGKLTLDRIEPYNSQRFYGCMMTFSVPNFRYTK